MLNKTGRKTAFVGKVGREELSEMLTFANAAASIVTTRKGALRVMPDIDKVEAFIKHRKR